MKRLWFLPMLVTIFVAACDSSTEPDDSVKLQVSSVTLEATGDTARLAVVVEGSTAAPRWESLDPGIVAVTADGLATAVAPGAAKVRATVGAARADGTVTVLPPVDIRVSELRVVTDPQGEQGVAMRIRNLGGRGYYRLEHWKLDPDGSKRRIVWYANEYEAAPGMDVSHASYLSDEIADWVVAYSREPMSEVPVRTACARMDGEAEPCPSDLPEPPTAADSVVVWPAAAVFAVGDTVQYLARAFAAGIELTGRRVIWSTPSPDVISLSTTGRVVALAPAYGQVNAMVDGVTTAVGLTVTAPAEPGDSVAMVAVRPERLRLWVGQAYRANAAALDVRRNVMAGKTITWSVRDSTVASVNAAGMVRAIGHGSTFVIATADGVNGYLPVESYARPVDSAELQLFGLMSSGEDPNTVMPSIDTTWVDDAGVTHDAWIQVRPGSLSMDWGDGPGRYTQRLVMTTYVHDNPGVRIVAVDEYLDSGSLEWWYDWTTGEQGFDFASTVTEGLTYTGKWSLPGELVVDQTVGTVAKRPYYFRLPF